MNDVINPEQPGQPQDPEQLLEDIVQEEKDREFKHEELREKLAQVLLKRRNEAVRYRAGLGIETNGPRTRPTTRVKRAVRASASTRG